MPSFRRPIALATPLARAMAVTALMGTTMLASPLIAARAASAATSQLQVAQATAPAAPTSPAPVTSAPQSASPTPAAPADQAAPANQAAPPAQTGDTTAQVNPETVDQRITDLHAALQITSQEEPKWDRVAQVMRDNAAAMQKLMAERDSQAGTITAVQDLQEYEKFTQAHMTGLHKLTVAFDALYKTMPASQKKVADDVFENFGHHKAAAAHS